MGTKPTLYLAGPMNKREFYNVIEFERFQAKWEGLGWHVVTPFDSSNRVWFKHYKRLFNPREDKCDYGDEKLKEMFVADVELLLSASAMALLPDWGSSAGCAIEISICHAFNIPVFFAEDSVVALQGHDHETGRAD